MTLIDPKTREKIAHQEKKRAYWLAQSPPDRREAEKCTARIDRLLDGRPKVHAVAADGEVIWSDAPAWIKDQVDPVVDYLDRRAEVVEPPKRYADDLAGGGTGLMEPPKPNAPQGTTDFISFHPEGMPESPDGKILPKITEADIVKFKKELDL
jgi:hypothetical protein